MGEGREGDWECGGCSNRNYAFRSFCNRCKQPRLLVDTKTPADSKWLPRIGDWVCSGCSNNNYASRDKCKKCGQPKEVAAIAMPGASLQAYAHYFARAHGAPGLKMNMGTMGNSSFQQSLPLNSNWSLGVADKYGHQSSSSWPISGSNNAGVSYGNNANQVAIPNGWRSGDWICKCGFHNYSSRQECKKCNSSLSSAHGTKRLASDEILGEWDNKRLHAGDINHNFLTHSHQNSYHSFDQTGGFNNGQSSAVYPYPSGSSGMALNPQVHIQLPQIATLPTLLGKGAKQWRDGDWMCTNCNNHNYASREECNRCKTQKEIAKLPVDVS